PPLPSPALPSFPTRRSSDLRIVTASDFKDCPAITTPRLSLVKHCPANPVPPGGIATFSGTVSNAGNITLTNVLVFNNRPTNNTRSEEHTSELQSLRHLVCRL